MTPRMLWRGGNADGVADSLVGAFLRQGDRPGQLVIWWFEPDMTGSCDLLVSRELTTSDPVRVRPGEWLEFHGGEFARAKTAKAAS